MPYLISTMDGIRIDDMHMTAAQIAVSPLSGDQLNDAIVIAVKSPSETCKIYVHVLDKAQGEVCVLVTGPDAVVSEDWWVR